MDNGNSKIPYEKHISKFKKLILQKIFFPDKVISFVHNFIVDQLGTMFVDPPTFSLSKIFKNSRPDIPFIFILSPGVDPMLHIYKIAEDHKMKDNIRSISLGQGQGPIALRNIDEGTKNGFWIVLQNCHLAGPFLQKIELICEYVRDDYFEKKNYLKEKYFSYYSN